MQQVLPKHTMSPLEHKLCAMDIEELVEQSEELFWQHYSPGKRDRLTQEKQQSQHTARAASAAGSGQQSDNEQRRERYQRRVEPLRRRATGNLARGW